MRAWKREEDETICDFIARLQTVRIEHNLAAAYQEPDDNHYGSMRFDRIFKTKRQYKHFAGVKRLANRENVQRDRQKNDSEF